MDENNIMVDIDVEALANTIDSTVGNFSLAGDNQSDTWVGIDVQTTTT